MLLATGVIINEHVYAQKINKMSKNNLKNMEFYGSLTSKSGFKVDTVITYGDEKKEWPKLTLIIFDDQNKQLYESVKYAAWFNIKLGWDEKDRFWIKSSDTGIDVITESKNQWTRHRWDNSQNIKSIIDIENNERLEVVNWPLPEFLN